MTKPEKPTTDKSKPTPRNVAKFVVKEGIAIQLTLVTRRVVSATTELDVDYLPVKLGCMMVGHFTAAMLEPITDKAVDQTFDTTINFVSKRRSDRKTKRQAKKDAKKIAKQD